jgi:glycosyltransferase involved in cell wall biosynthesis
MAGIPQDEAYFKEQIEPQIDGDAVQFIGPVQGDARNDLLSHALALVHMTTRPERFGLTLIEAMACGTPVLGARMGSIPEIVVDGVTGFLCDSVEDAAEKAHGLAKLDRHACRQHVESTFSVDCMIDRYIGAYTEALALGTPPAPNNKTLAARKHDWWDRPQAYTDIPEKPKSLRFS